MDKKAFPKYILSNLLFGANGIFAAAIALSSTQIVLLRTLIGSLSLTALFLLSGGRFTFYRKKQATLFLLLSGICMGTSWMFLYEAYARIGVSIGTLLYYCGPVIVMVTSPLFFREKLTARKMLSFLVVLIGVCLINGQILDGTADLPGILFGLLSAVTYSGMVIFNKKAKDLSGLENPTLQLIASFLTVAAFMALGQGLPFPIDGSDLLPIAFLGLLGTGLGCYLYFTTIGSLPVQTVALWGYLELAAAVIFAAIFLHETMTPLQWLGGLAIATGPLLAQRPHQPS